MRFAFSLPFVLSLIGLCCANETCAFGAMEGKVCLVTGASRGIGRGIAIGLGSKGACVYVTGRNAATLKATVEDVKRAGGEARAVVCDHSDPGAIKVHIPQKNLCD